MPHSAFVTTTTGLNRQHPAMRLFEKAKRLGVWNPSEIDFSQDIEDWRGLAADEQDILLRLTALFQAGEEAVTLDLLPLIQVISAEGRLEEEMFLTSFLWEEAKHTDFFHRFLSEVALARPAELDRFHSPNYRTVIYEALPDALLRLKTDASPAAQVRAAVIYNMIVEGVLAETGYHAYFTVLDQQNILPGQRRGISLLKLDEARHIAYGIFLLSRLISADPTLWPIIEQAMNALLIPALGVVTDVFDAYDPAPFGLNESMFIDFAVSQFDKRLARLEKARGATLDDIFRVTREVIEQDDA